VHVYLRQRIEAAELAGIDPERNPIVPGIGFGKGLDLNLELMAGGGALLDLGRPVLVGPSRKKFIGTILDLPEEERVEGTVGAVVWMVARGAHLVRVHDVKEVVRAVRVADAIARGAG
jgi:dihydropteroate synthase